MSSYRGDGYGVHGDHGDDDDRSDEGRNDEGRRDRWREERGEREQGGFFHRERADEPEHGAAHGNLMGRAEQRVREWTEGGHYDEGRPGEDPRARQAAGDWNRRFGREGYEGSYGQHLHDEPYRSFRDRHIAEMDSDYHAWREDREQEFHRDFDSWRSRRRPADLTGQQDEMPALELSDAAHATSPETPVTAEQQPGAAGSPASRRRASSGSTPGGTEAPTDEPGDR